MRHVQTNETEEKVFSFIKEHRLLCPNDRVVAGISGGADSVCLLFVLLAWKERYGLELSVVHVNHGIRPEAAQDAEFVEHLCGRLGVPFTLREADIPELARREGCTEEEAGRNFRYQVFAEAAETFSELSDQKMQPVVKIAVAHNLNDCGETMLFHLFRGSGIKGLVGIAPQRGNVIRPLLCLERGEIEAYLAEKGQDYCKDVTNDEDDHTRNRIRHHILPYAEREITPGCVRHMGHTAEILSETEDYLELQTRAALEECLVGGGGRDNIYILSCDKFSSFHPAIQKRMLHVLAKALSPGAKDISYVHIKALCSLFSQEGNRRINLPFGIWGRREYDRVILERGQQEESLLEYMQQDRIILERGQQDNVIPERVQQTNETGQNGQPCGGEGQNGTPNKGIRPVFEILAIEELPRGEENSLIFPQNQYTKWFDYDKIKKWPVLRTRRQGDYLMVTDGQGTPHHKSIKDYMVTEKIPRSDRERIPVLAEDSHVLWLVGYRISEYYKIDENTKRVLQVQLITGP